MKEYFYARVSSIDQNESRQLDAIAKLQIPSSRIYIDKKSGGDFERPAKKPPNKSAEIADKRESGEISLIEALEQTGLPKTAFYRFFREYKKQK